MNVEKLQQINALANELKKHNFAITNDDAFKQAEEAYGLRQQPLQTHTTQYESQHIQRVEEDLTRENKLQDRRVELLLEMNNKKYDQEIDTFRSAINQLIGELNDVKAQLAELKSQPQQKPAHKEKQTELKKEEPHPRQGNFSSGDVDIQKMFYFGNKK